MVGVVWIHYQINIKPMTPTYSIIFMVLLTDFIYIIYCCLCVLLSPLNLLNMFVFSIKISGIHKLAFMDMLWTLVVKTGWIVWTFPVRPLPHNYCQIITQSSAKPSLGFQSGSPGWVWWNIEEPLTSEKGCLYSF